MADIEVKEKSGGKGPGVKKQKKANIRMDLTPMVDLGFLLITFFIFTISMEQATSMNLSMPKDTQDQEQQTKVKESGSLVLLLGKGNVIYYYYGDKPDQVENTNYKDVRDIILAKKKSTPPDDLFIIIKPDEDATYANAVDILDEMNINDITRYSMVDPDENEVEIIHKAESAAGI